MSDDEPGPTGKFPQGSLNKDDEGELKMLISHDGEGKVIIDFGKPVRWVGMSSTEAVDLARVLISHANAREKIVQ